MKSLKHPTPFSIVAFYIASEEFFVFALYVVTKNYDNAFKILPIIHFWKGYFKDLKVM